MQSTTEKSTVLTSLLSPAPLFGRCMDRIGFFDVKPPPTFSFFSFFFWDPSPAATRPLLCVLYTRLASTFSPKEPSPAADSIVVDNGLLFYIFHNYHSPNSSLSPPETFNNAFPEISSPPISTLPPLLPLLSHFSAGTFFLLPFFVLLVAAVFSF